MVLYCHDIGAVRRISVQAGWVLSSWLARTSGAAQRLFVKYLPSELPIAVALFLGRYELTEDEVTELFVRTGTMNVLGMSGLYMDIISDFLRLIARLFPIENQYNAIVIGLACIAYAY